MFCYKKINKNKDINHLAKANYTLEGYRGLQPNLTPMCDTQQTSQTGRQVHHRGRERKPSNIHISIQEYFRLTHFCR